MCLVCSGAAAPWSHRITCLHPSSIAVTCPLDSFCTCAAGFCTTLPGKGPLYVYGFDSTGLVADHLDYAELPGGGPPMNKTSPILNADGARASPVFLHEFATTKDYLIFIDNPIDFGIRQVCARPRQHSMLHHGHPHNTRVCSSIACMLACNSCVVEGTPGQQRTSRTSDHDDSPVLLQQCCPATYTSSWHPCTV